MTSVDLPEPDTPGDGAEQAQRDPHVDVLEVVLGDPLDEDLAGRLAPLLGDRDQRECRARNWPGQRLGIGLHLRRRALGDDVPAVLAGPGAHVDHVIGRAHRPLVVLDHDHRVPEVAQALQRADQPLVVALVQADRRLVEDVEDADERRADLRGQADALGLAAGERRRRPVHRQVADPDVLQEAQPLVDLAQDQPGDLAIGVRELARPRASAAPDGRTAP